MNKISGFEVSNFPASRSDKEVQEYVENDIGKKVDSIEYIRKNKKLSVRVQTEGNITGKEVIEAINKMQFTVTKEKVFGNPLYCRVIRDLTPKKDNKTSGQEKGILKSPVLSFGSVTDKRTIERIKSPGISPDPKKPNLL